VTSTRTLASEAFRIALKRTDGDAKRAYLLVLGLFALRSAKAGRVMSPARSAVAFPEVPPRTLPAVPGPRPGRLGSGGVR